MTNLLGTSLAPLTLSERQIELIEALEIDCENYHALLGEDFLVENQVSLDELYQLMDNTAFALKVFRRMPAKLVASYLGEALADEASNVAKGGV